MGERRQSNKQMNGHSKLTTIYLHTFQTVLDRMSACLMTIHNRFLCCSNTFCCFLCLSTCAAHLSFVLFGSLSWWLKIWMILCLHKIFYCRLTLLHFRLQKNVLTKQNSYGMVTCYGNWTVKYSLTTNWIRAFIEMGSPVRKYGNRQYTQVSFFSVFFEKKFT